MRKDRPPTRIAGKSPAWIIRYTVMRATRRAEAISSTVRYSHEPRVVSVTLFSPLRSALLCVQACDLHFCAPTGEFSRGQFRTVPRKLPQVTAQPSACGESL